jgi:hypothetical protein
MKAKAAISHNSIVKNENNPAFDCLEEKNNAWPIYVLEWKE